MPTWSVVINYIFDTIATFQQIHKTISVDLLMVWILVTETLYWVSLNVELTFAIVSDQFK